MTDILRRVAFLIVGAVAASALSACMLVPGSNIVPADYQANAGIGSRSDSRALQAVDVYSINAQLVDDQARLFASANQVLPAIPDSLQQDIANYQYYVDRGDILQITVYDHPELNNPGGSLNSGSVGFTVENDGAIYYPYIGKVLVAGHTVDQVRAAIAAPLRDFITAPQVSVSVIAYNARRAYITGQVENPGAQPISNVPLTVLDAIANAGGLSANANWHDVLLSRNGQEIRLSLYEMLNNGRLGQNMLLQHGDVLHVPEAGQRLIFVMGELNNVNVLPAGNLPMSLTEALTRSGGLNQITSNARGIFVIRPNAPGEQKFASIYQLDVANAVSFAIGAQFQLQPSDIVYVTTAPVTRWNRVISQLLPSLGALITADQVGNL
jgi:polysaccharide biosynthesis/export protein